MIIDTSNFLLLDVNKVKSSPISRIYLVFPLPDRQGHEWGRAQILHEDEVNPNYDGEAGVIPVQAEDVRRLSLARSSDTEDDKFSEVSK